MKKRNPAILTEEDWEDVESWLDKIPIEKQSECPWRMLTQQQDEKCLALFPKLMSINWKAINMSLCQCRCPCHAYNLKYVVRVAKQLLLQKRRQTK